MEEKRKRGRPRKSSDDEIACRFDDMSIQMQSRLLDQLRTIHMLAQRRVRQDAVRSLPEDLRSGKDAAGHVDSGVKRLDFGEGREVT